MEKRHLNLQGIRVDVVDLCIFWSTEDTLNPRNIAVENKNDVCSIQCTIFKAFTPMVANIKVMIVRKIEVSRDSFLFDISIRAWQYWFQ